MDAAAVAGLMRLTDRELWLVTACANGRRSGLIATFVSPASIVPTLPRMVVGLARCHYTYDLVETSRAFALHLLGEEHLDWVWRFALQSGRDVDKLQGLTLQTGTTGSPLLTDALGWLDCRVEGRLNTGDRSLFLGEVVEGHLARATPPLTLSRFRQIAPAEHLRRLQELEEQDSAADAAGIQAWRQLLAR
ncbi:MAG: flavin reductase [Planctomycetes bacterium]|nr:flavin reductase [Planctomycetota bacterium]